MQNLDFIAELKFLTTQESGRENAAKSGYRPHIEFENYPEYLTSGHQQYLDKEEVFPGESVQAGIKILGTEYFSKRLYKGKRFRFFEGSKTMGFGEIITILNADLEMPESEEESEFNLNLFPPDILERIRLNFGDDSGEVVRELQTYLMENKNGRSPRIIRSIISLTGENKDALKRKIKIAQIDWRDVLLAAEYENQSSLHPRRVRDFNRKFGAEKI